MLDFLGTVATAALIVFVISTLLVFLDVSRETKIVMAALLGLWVGIATAGSAAGRPGIAHGTKRDSAERIQQRAMAARVQQPPVVMLAVAFDQHVGQLPQHLA